MHHDHHYHHHHASTTTPAAPRQHHPLEHLLGLILTLWQRTSGCIFRKTHQHLPMNILLDSLHNRKFSRLQNFPKQLNHFPREEKDWPGCWQGCHREQSHSVPWKRNKSSVNPFHSQFLKICDTRHMGRSMHRQNKKGSLMAPEQWQGPVFCLLNSNQ